MLCVFVFWCRCHRHRAFVRTCPGNCSVEICVCKCVCACVYVFVFVRVFVHAFTVCACVHKSACSFYSSVCEKPVVIAHQ